MGRRTFQCWAGPRLGRRSRGPLLLQKLSKTPFETMKYLAKDAAWMKSETNGELLGALAKVTYHLRREKGESFRSFFGRWVVAMRKVTEHGATLPEKYIGFLLINALNVQDPDIKSLVSFTRGPSSRKRSGTGCANEAAGFSGCNGATPGEGEQALLRGRPGRPRGGGRRAAHDGGGPEGPKRRQRRRCSRRHGRGR